MYMFVLITALKSNGVETGDQRCLRVMQLLMLRLPRNNLSVAKRLVPLLHDVAAQPANKMDACSLAKLFAPHLLCSRESMSDPVIFQVWQ